MTDSKIDLKPCPFCLDGGSPEIVSDDTPSNYAGNRDEYYHNGAEYRRSRCKVCGSEGHKVHRKFFNEFSQYRKSDFDTNDGLYSEEWKKYEQYKISVDFEAVSVWNVRADNNALTKAVEALRYIVEELDSDDGYLSIAQKIARNALKEIEAST